MKKQTMKQALIVLILLFTVGVPALQAQKDIIAVTPVGENPVAVTINPTAGQAFVLNKMSKDVYIIDLKTRAVVGKYLVGGIPEGLAINPQTNTLVVVSLDGAATIIDHAAGQIVGVVPVGKAPSRVAIDTDKNAALITNFSGSNMVVLDLASRQVTQTIPLRNGPLGIAVLEGKRRAVVACQYDMEILQVDLNKNNVDQSLLIGRYLSEVATNAATGKVVVGNPSNNGILSVYDPVANSIVSTTPVGHGPLSVAVYPKRNIAVVAEFDSDSVSILALDTSTVVRSAKVGKGPRGIAVDPQTGIVIVVNKLDNNAVFLDLNALLAVGNPQ